MADGRHDGAPTQRGSVRGPRAAEVDPAARGGHGRGADRFYPIYA